MKELTKKNIIESMFEMRDEFKKLYAERKISYYDCLCYSLGTRTKNEVKLMRKTKAELSTMHNNMRRYLQGIEIGFKN